VATIEKRMRNGKTTYRVRYRDPAGAQRSKVFARKADAQRFLNETETAKARGTWTDPALGRVLFRDWLGSGGQPPPTCGPRLGTGTSCSSVALPCRASGRCRWPRSVNATCAPGWPS
jgi:hypothetical protein